MELLEVLDSIRSDDNRLTGFFNEADGSAPINRYKRLQTSPQYKMKLAGAAKFVAEIATGRRPAYQLREVMTTSDFPLLFADILDRSVLASYQEWPSIWSTIAKRVLVNDFKDAKIFPPTWGADGPLSEVPQADQYADAAIYEQTPLTWHVSKYGRKVPFSWESIINDDLDQLKDIPERLGRAARRTESALVTALYVGSTGLNTTMFTTAAHNIVNVTNGGAATNPPLSIEGLEDAYTVMANMVDENSQPILREALTLVIPPALEVTAMNILNATEIRTTRRGGIADNASGSGYQELNARNWMASRIKVQVDPYIPLTASTNGKTTWFLFADPAYSREAMRIGFLRGHESPEVWMKAPTAVRAGGGVVDAMEGDFDTDAIIYRVRHVTGVKQVDQKAVVGSNGSGS